MKINREFENVLLSRVNEQKPLIQVLIGPRQVGKTTGLKSLLEKYKGPSQYVSADNVNPLDLNWIDLQWQEASRPDNHCLLIIDEIQKIENWQSKVKQLWDNNPFNIKLILTGSSSLNLILGLSESMAGRYELTYAYHWDYVETNSLSPMTIDTFMKVGGYPASYQFLNDPPRFQDYLKLSILENVIMKDILAFRQVKSPALFRQTFEIICSFPAQEISYNKLLGQIQDKGNIDLVKSYLELFESALLIKTIYKYSIKKLVKKGSSPKIILMSPCFYNLFYQPGEEDKSTWNFESSVGAALVKINGTELYYWREGKAEVDFVINYNKTLFAIEVKSGRKKSPKGILEFQKKYPHAKALFITRDNYIDFITNPKSFLIQ